MFVGNSCYRSPERNLAAFALELCINKRIEARNTVLLDVERVIARTSFFLLAIYFVLSSLGKCIGNVCM